MNESAKKMKRPNLLGLLLDENGRPLLTNAATTTAGDPNDNTNGDLDDAGSSPGGDGEVGF